MAKVNTPKQRGWQEYYNQRTAVERVNSRLKEFTKLDNLKVRGLVKIRLHGLVAMLVVQAKTIVAINANSEHKNHNLVGRLLPVK